MFKHIKLQKLEEYFSPMNNRTQNGMFFYRINGYSEEVRIFIQEYYNKARQSGIVIEGKIPNPDEKNLSYYSEVMGMDFQLNSGFVLESLKKWLPRLNGYQHQIVSASLYHILDGLKKEGKTDNILKNAYIKFMCWLYYRFERVVNQLGGNNIPKILYEGSISSYEWKLMTLLSYSGCDIVLLQYHGDEEYQKLDPNSLISESFPMEGLTDFPDHFSIKQIRSELDQKVRLQRIYGSLPEITNATNSWIEGKGLNDVLTPPPLRGSDTRFFYNCFIRINGVEDKIGHLNELYQFYLHFKNTNRKLVIINYDLPKPSPEEISSIKRVNYVDFEQMLMDLSNNIQFTTKPELQKILKKVFIDVMFEENKGTDQALNRITNKAIYLLCWLKRYQNLLFSDWTKQEIACFIYLGGCKSEYEALFIRFLSRLPVDVILLIPDLNQKCCLSDSLLYEINHLNSVSITKFPSEADELQMGTTAYHAERELDSLMYQDSGIYRNQQYGKSTTIVLRTMYEEIAIMWDQELKYRQNFSVVNDLVNLPVIFAKISGVKDKLVSTYWADIKKLITEDTFVIKKAPFITAVDANPIKPYATGFIRNGKLQREAIMRHKEYPYSMLREEMQQHILNKLQLLLDQKIIKGTFQNGTEFTIISTVFHLNQALIRLIQKFDFTKKNPKLVYFNGTEAMVSLEDSILTAFLSLLGFDVIFFVPTGYQTVEKHFNKLIMEEHQIGDYMYDLSLPDFNSILGNIRPASWLERWKKR